MLIVDVKQGETIDKAIKRYKKKFEKTGILKQIRERQTYTKPSVKKRMAKLKDVFKQEVIQEMQ